MKSLLRFGVLIGLALVSGPAFSAGAIAVDDQQGLAAREAGYGFVTGYSTRREAANAAMDECEAHGNSSCKVVVRFDTCGAYAGNRNYFGIGWGDTEKEARRAAINDCGGNSCKIVTSGCE